MTKELTDMLRKNRTIDWQKKESARAGMRKMVKRLLKKYHYPPEEAQHAMETVMAQCEQWADYDGDYEDEPKGYIINADFSQQMSMAADPGTEYGKQK